MEAIIYLINGDVLRPLNSYRELEREMLDKSLFLTTTVNKNSGGAGYYDELVIIPKDKILYISQRLNK